MWQYDTHFGVVTDARITAWEDELIKRKEDLPIPEVTFKPTR